MFNPNAILPPKYNYANPYGFATPIVNNFYENTIRTSNTVFSTMSCPECGSRLTFESEDNFISAFCPTRKHYVKVMSPEELCTLINNNGINSLVTSFAYIHPAIRNESEDTDEPTKEPEPPDGFKIEPANGDD